MLKEEHKKLLPYDLYVQIEEIMKAMQQLQIEAAGIANAANVSDAAAHLNDVIKHSETATVTIIETVGNIQTIADAAGGEAGAKIGEEITKIYEACSFQDIGSQRILKVMKNLSAIEVGLQRLAQMAKHYGVETPAAPPADKGDPLLQGPQLAGDAPSQADIDKLFNS